MFVNQTIMLDAREFLGMFRRSHGMSYLVISNFNSFKLSLNLAVEIFRAGSSPSAPVHHEKLLINTYRLAQW